MSMDPNALLNWLVVLTRVASGTATVQGKSELAGHLSELADAAAAGKRIDDVMADLAKEWAEHGEPTLESINAKRKTIQTRLAITEKELKPSASATKDPA